MPFICRPLLSLFALAASHCHHILLIRPRSGLCVPGNEVHRYGLRKPPVCPLQPVGENCSELVKEIPKFQLSRKSSVDCDLAAAEADQRLECLGAERVYERGEGDDDQNIEEDFEQRGPLALGTYIDFAAPFSIP